MSASVADAQSLDEGTDGACTCFRSEDEDNNDNGNDDEDSGGGSYGRE